MLKGMLTYNRCMNIPFLSHFQNHDVELMLESIDKACENTDWVDDVHYSIIRKATNQKVGICDLRVGMNDTVYYVGQIGYRVYLPYRGNGYAYKATQQLLAIAKDEYGMKDVIITCSPENIASLKTIQKLNGTFIEEIDVPSEHYLYKRGEKVKYIYKCTI